MEDTSFVFEWPTTARIQVIEQRLNPRPKPPKMESPKEAETPLEASDLFYEEQIIREIRRRLEEMVKEHEREFGKRWDGDKP